MGTDVAGLGFDTKSNCFAVLKRDREHNFDGIGAEVMVAEQSI